ncbi:hypothetical protein ABFS83_14G321000 [Erythranthe nasuta]
MLLLSFQDYCQQLAGLYKLGARKVIVAGVGQIGCMPYQLAQYNGNGTNKCNEEINSAIVSKYWWINLINGVSFQGQSLFTWIHLRLWGWKKQWADNMPSSSSSV